MQARLTAFQGKNDRVMAQFRRSDFMQAAIDERPTLLPHTLSALSQHTNIPLGHLGRAIDTRAPFHA